MKKILLILSLFFSSSFSDTCQIDNENNYASCLDGKCYVPTTVYWERSLSSNPGSYGNSIYLQLGDPYPSLWATNNKSNLDGIAYNAKEVLCGVKYVPEPECTESETQNEDCTCKPGYTEFYDDGGNQEGCILDCTPTHVTNPNPNEWIDLGLTTSELCLNFLIDRQIDGTFLSIDDGCGATSSACYGQNVVSPCDNLDNPLTKIPSGGYVYLGIVPNVSTCSSYVYAGSSYLDSITSPVDSDCSSNDSLYCYVLPIDLDGDETNAIIPTPNEDGTIPNTGENDIGFNPDLNLQDPQVFNNQILKDIKDMQSALKLNYDEHNTWVKDKFGTWQPSDFKTDMSSTNSAIENTTNSVNNQTNILAEKLDTINQSIKDKNLTVNIDLNSTNDLLSNILNGSGENNGSSSVKSYIDSSYSNFKSQYDNVKSQVDNAVGILNGKGLDSVLTSNVVDTCPKSFIFDISSTISKDISIDPCIVFSQSREYMYTFSYIGFSAMYISFLVGMIVRV